MKQLPIYKLRISEDDENNAQVEAIAMVDRPAIMNNWMAFKNHERFRVADEEKRMVTGAFMIANLPIYRMDEEIGEHYVVFDKEEIFKVVKKFFRTGKTSSFNIMHDPNTPADNVYLIESFIIDESRGIVPPKGFKGITDGSWMGTVKIDNEKLWQEFIKTGELQGFSVEGVFSKNLVSVRDEAEIIEIENVIRALEK